MAYSFTCKKKSVADEATLFCNSKKYAEYQLYKMQISRFSYVDSFFIKRYLYFDIIKGLVSYI